MNAKIILWFVSIVFVVHGLCACSGGGGGGISLPQSSYNLYVPDNFKPNESALVIVLHPKNSTGWAMQNLTGLNAKAKEVGFAVVYPDASGGPRTTGNWAWFFRDDRHIDYLRTMIRSIQSSLNPDPKKIYVVGYSYGGIMAHRVGVQLSDLVAAIGVVGGSLYENESSKPLESISVPAAVAPVSVMILHGDLDAENNVGYCGRGNIYPTQDMVFDYWIGSSANNCTSFDPSALLCSGSIPTKTDARFATGCDGGTEVQFYRLIGGRHEFHNVQGNWSKPMNVPGAEPYNPNFNEETGVTTNDILWNFFAAHPKP